MNSNLKKVLLAFFESVWKMERWSNMRTGGAVAVN